MNDFDIEEIERREKMLDDLREMWERNDKEYINFEAVENKRSPCRDLHAFLLLQELAPAEFDVIDAACHDVIYLSTDVEKLAEVITEDQAIELIRCGVRFEDEGLSMFR